MSILELARIDVTPGSEEAFEAAVAEAVPHFIEAEGCLGMKLTRSHERPSHYELMVRWETLEHHTVGFRGGAGFQAWRALVGQYFESPPDVEHVTTVLTGF